MEDRIWDFNLRLIVAGHLKPYALLLIPAAELWRLLKLTEALM